MSRDRTASEILDREFLETRAKLLQLAADFDRLDRADQGEDLSQEPRLAQIRQALDAVRDDGPGRAEAVQRIFSDPYEPNWQRELAPSRPS